MYRQLALGALASTSFAAIFSAQPANALCLTAQAGNNCNTFNPTTTSSVVQTYTSQNLTSNQYFQIGFRSSDGAAYSISNIKYSTDNTTFTDYTPGSLTTGSSYSLGSILNIPTTDPFYISYDIPSGIPDTINIDSVFKANDDGFVNGNGALDSASGNRFTNIERSSLSTSIPVPAPLPILGAAAAFSQVRRLRSMSRELN